MAKASEERGLLLLKKKNLEKEVADLKVAMLPAEDEPEGISIFKTHADMVARIQVLNSDCVDALFDGFEIAMAQLTFLNSGLNTEDAGVLSQVVDGRVVPPPKSSDLEIEEGTPRSD